MSELPFPPDSLNTGGRLTNRSAPLPLHPNPTLWFNVFNKRWRFCSSVHFSSFCSLTPTYLRETLVFCPAGGMNKGLSLPSNTDNHSGTFSERLITFRQHERLGDPEFVERWRRRPVFAFLALTLRGGPAAKFLRRLWLLRADFLQLRGGGEASKTNLREEHQTGRDDGCSHTFTWTQTEGCGKQVSVTPTQFNKWKRTNTKPTGSVSLHTIWDFPHKKHELLFKCMKTILVSCWGKLWILLSFSFLGLFFMQEHEQMLKAERFHLLMRSVYKMLHQLRAYFCIKMQQQQKKSCFFLLL